jgi:hypothetical protein
MKLLPQVLLVDDNPADVGRTQAALAGGRHQSKATSAIKEMAKTSYRERKHKNNAT